MFNHAVPYHYDDDATSINAAAGLLERSPANTLMFLSEMDDGTFFVSLGYEGQQAVPMAVFMDDVNQYARDNGMEVTFDLLADKMLADERRIAVVWQTHEIQEIMDSYIHGLMPVIEAMNERFTCLMLWGMGPRASALFIKDKAAFVDDVL